MQAAAAYDSAARQIRGDSAICNFPLTAQEEENTARYLDRLAASVRKRRHVSADAEQPPLCLRRLTARQKAKLASSGGLFQETDGKVCVYCRNTKFWFTLNIEPVPTVPKNTSVRLESLEAEDKC